MPKPVPICIRRIRPGDWSALRDLRLRSLQEDPLAFGSTFARESTYPESKWVQFALRGARSSSSGQWVAVGPRGALVGTVAAAEVDGAPHLFAMWVDPSFRARGIGGRLLDAALTWVRGSFPGRELLLEVNPRQRSAIRLYESRGFRAAGTRRDLGHSVGEVCEEMRLLPREPRAVGRRS